MIDTKKLIRLINNSKLLINTTEKNKETLIDKIKSLNSSKYFYDETVWTFLSILPYSTNKKNISDLFNILTNDNKLFESDKSLIIYKTPVGFDVFTDFSEKIKLSHSNLNDFFGKIERKKKKINKYFDGYIGFFVGYKWFGNRKTISKFTPHYFTPHH